MIKYNIIFIYLFISLNICSCPLGNRDTIIELRLLHRGVKTSIVGEMNYSNILILTYYIYTTSIIKGIIHINNTSHSFLIVLHL